MTPRLLFPFKSFKFLSENRRLCQNRERTGVPGRAARAGWWMRPDPTTLSGKRHDHARWFSRRLDDPVATALGSATLFAPAPLLRDTIEALRAGQFVSVRRPVIFAF